MKANVLTSLLIYEFQFDDLTYVDKLYEDLTKLDLALTGLPPEVEKKSPKQGPVGYLAWDDEIKMLVPYYDLRLFSWFDEQVAKVASLHFNHETSPQVDFAICDSWLVLTEHSSEPTALHVHANSVLTGLFYFTDHIDSPTVFVYSDAFKKGYDSLLDNSGGTPDRYYESPAKKGKLLIFPSYLRHQIGIHSDNSLRVTLSFNAFPTGRTNFPTGSIVIHTQSVKERNEEYFNKLNNSRSE